MTARKPIRKPSARRPSTKLSIAKLIRTLPRAAGLLLLGLSASACYDYDAEDLDGTGLELELLCGEAEGTQLVGCVRELTSDAEDASNEELVGVQSGEVTWYDQEHGVGFITSGRLDFIYVSHTELAPGTVALEVGDAVSFQLVVETDGFKWADEVARQR